MSEERLERIENQLGQVLQAIIGVDNRVSDLENRMDARMTGLENRMTGLEDRMTGLEVRMTGLEDRMTGLEVRMTGLENRMNTRMADLENRMNDRMTVLEGTLSVMMRGGFNSLRGIVNDIDVDLAKVEQRAEDSARKVRRLNQRLMHLEGRTEEDGEA